VCKAWEQFLFFSLQQMTEAKSTLALSRVHAIEETHYEDAQHENAA